MTKELHKLMRLLGRTISTTLQQKLVQIFLWLFFFATFVQLLCWAANKFEIHENVIDTIPACLLLVLAMVTTAV